MTETNAVRIVGLSGLPGQGPHMIFILTVTAGRIVAAKYSTYGCSVAENCGQWVCEAIEGKEFAHAAMLDESLLIRSIGHMPLGREHCPGLAISALKHALNEIQKTITS